MMTQPLNIYSIGLSEQACWRDRLLSDLRLEYQSGRDVAQIRVWLCARIGIEFRARLPQADCLAADIELVHEAFNDMLVWLRHYSGVSYESGQAVLFHGRWPQCEN